MLITWHLKTRRLTLFIVNKGTINEFYFFGFFGGASEAGRWLVDWNKSDEDIQNIFNVREEPACIIGHFKFEFFTSCSHPTFTNHAEQH